MPDFQTLSQAIIQVEHYQVKQMGFLSASSFLLCDGFLNNFESFGTIFGGFYGKSALGEDLAQHKALL